jgi:hypothetical protein
VLHVLQPAGIEGKVGGSDLGLGIVVILEGGGATGVCFCHTRTISISLYA